MPGAFSVATATDDGADERDFSLRRLERHVFAREELHDRPQQRGAGERSADPDTDQASDRSPRLVQNPRDRALAVHHRDHDGGERKPVAPGAHERALRKIEFLQPDPRERDENQRRRNREEAHVCERHRERACATRRGPDPVHVVRQKPEQHGLHHRYHDSDDRDALAPERVGDAEHNQRLPGQAHGERELPAKSFSGAFRNSAEATPHAMTPTTSAAPAFLMMKLKPSPTKIRRNSAPNHPATPSITRTNHGEWPASASGAAPCTSPA
jgi:hypothetical protein